MASFGVSSSAVQSWSQLHSLTFLSPVIARSSADSTRSSSGRLEPSLIGRFGQRHPGIDHPCQCFEHVGVWL